MSKQEITQYFAATAFRDIREDLKCAVNEVSGPKVAVDCGCGAGADINYLIGQGFTVHGFDIEQEAISRCQARFAGNPKVFLSQASFTSFNYPKASLVVADASLFFCPPRNFKNVWQTISNSLYPDGIFCGSFLGNEDTMAIPGDNPSVYWPAISAFDEHEVKSLFRQFDILRFNIHKSSGKTPQGLDHNWHIFQVIARKHAPQTI